MLSDGKYKKYLTPVYLFSYLILLAFVVHAILLIENPEGRFPLEMRNCSGL